MVRSIYATNCLKPFDHFMKLLDLFNKPLKLLYKTSWLNLYKTSRPIFFMIQLFAYIFIFVDGQTAGSNRFNYFEDIHGYPANGTSVKQIRNFNLFFIKVFWYSTSNAWHLLTYLTLSKLLSFFKTICICILLPWLID